VEKFFQFARDEACSIIGTAVRLNICCVRRSPVEEIEK
jgi:hypothetical protein